MRNQPGFSLLEVLIALAILSIGLLAYAQAQIDAVRNTEAAYIQSLNDWQAHALIEQKYCLAGVHG